jgi:hypothetical protein
MFLETKTVKSNLGCALLDVPAMLPLRAPTMVPPRAPTMVPLRLARAPTIVPPRTVEETLIVRTAIQRVAFKRLMSFSLSVSCSWRKPHPTCRHLRNLSKCPYLFQCLCQNVRRTCVPVNDSCPITYRPPKSVFALRMKADTLATCYTTPSNNRRVEPNLIANVSNACGNRSRKCLYTPVAMDTYYPSVDCRWIYLPL